MKKQLLATTALVGASLLVTGDALAQASPITMGVKGYWRMFIEAVDSPSSGNIALNPSNPNGSTPTYTGTTGTANTRGNQRGYIHDLESRTFFVGEGKLDNGITPGVNIQFETFNRNGSLPAGGSAAGTNAANGFFGNQERRARGYFKTAWGEVGMGNVDNIGRLYATYEAILPGIGLLGVDSPSGAYPLGTNNTFPDLASGATRVYYLSPKFAGFDFGFSYAPDAQSDVRSGAGSGAFVPFDGVGQNRYAGTASQNWTPMIRYINTLGPVSIGADYSYTGSTNECRGRVTAGVANFSAGCVGQDSNASTHALHANVSWMGFRLGIGFAQWVNVDGNNRNRTTIAPGIDYTTGPWSFGLYYSTGDYDTYRLPAAGNGGGTQQTTAGSLKSTDNLQAISPAVGYLLGPGAMLQASYMYQRVKYGPNASFRNAADFGNTTLSTQSANIFVFGANFSY